MPITPIGRPKQKEGGTWDTISKAMGFVSTAMNVADTFGKALSPAADAALTEIPKTGVDATPAAAMKMDNPYLRRRYSNIG